jgi:cytochrome c oxidase subunit 1
MPTVDAPAGTVPDAAPTAVNRLGAREFGVAALSGAVGMVAMAPVLALVVLVGAMDLSGFESLAELSLLGPSVPLGVAVFFAGGVVTLPLVFLALAMFLPGRTLARRGAIFAAVFWVGFAIAFYTGVAGAALAAYLALTLAAHLAYGAVFGAVYDRFGGVPVYEV